MNLRALGLSIVLSTFGLETAFSQGEVFIVPNDTGVVYSEYVRLGLNLGRARFQRWTIDDFGSDMSPGARVGFRTDAEKVRLGLDLRADGFASGLPRLYVDGQLSDAIIGDGSEGVVWATVFEQSTALPHEFSLVMPYDVPTDFLGITLEGGSPALLDPPQRPVPLYVSYGDSITHGFTVTDIAATYSHLVAEQKDWSVINMGFGGHRLTARDGYAVGDLEPDVVSSAIGVNDYHSSTPLIEFRQSYDKFLDNLRERRPNAVVYIITPTWIQDEDVLNAAGLKLESYRQVIREFVDARADADPNLLLLEGLDLIPSGLEYFPDGVHPNDAGNALIAAAIVNPNLVRDGGFGQTTAVWNLTGATTVGPDLLGDRHLVLGMSYGFASQRIYGLQPGEPYVFEATSFVTDPSSEGAYGVAFFDADGIWISLATLDIEWTLQETTGFTFVVPVDARRAEAWLWKSEGPGQMVLDDVSVRGLDSSQE